ncbi:hypothetical protein FZEAL_3943 [Fusarium zealandicum]|uniref:DUF7580 domain-containing protein n=1 Tax=Fusarium zealandicum TaxID=1053134 RepID=A0A8H4UMP6_9HYPO|nr:hypothetical protein FZEAL_3943 [Fusarium zealandicum]
MSGFEVAGIVLGSIPLIIEALEAYSKFLQDWGRAPSELRSLKRQLTTERAKLYNICEQLISDVVAQNEIEPMLENPFGPLWQAQEVNNRVRQRLWGAYTEFEATLLEVQETLNVLTQRLNIHVTPDGQVQWMNKGWITREFKKLLYRLRRNDFQDALSTISRGIADLETLAHPSISLESHRQTRSRGKVFTILRELSLSIYRALCTSLNCTHPHHVSFELATRFIDIGRDNNDDSIMSNAQFKIAISFEIAQGLRTNRFWDEINIKTVPFSPMAQLAPWKRLPSANKGNEKKRVRFSFNQALSRVSSAKSSSDIKRAVDAASQPATDLVFIKKAKEPIDLCLALRTNHVPRPVCYGTLVDGECTSRHFEVYPLGTTANSDEWSIVSLNDILEGNMGLRPLFSLVEKVRLALAVSSSMLQLGKTPWLPGALTGSNVHFFRRHNGGVSYDQPFLLQSLPKCSLPRSNYPTDTAAMCSTRSNVTVFALGILLLEIILGSTVGRLRQPKDSVFQGDDEGIINDAITADRLLRDQGAPSQDS